MTDQKDFAEMTASEIRNYRGPVFNARVKMRAYNGDIIYSDMECPSAAILKRHIDNIRTGHMQMIGVEYGPIVLENGIVVPTDPQTGQPQKDEPERYITRSQSFA